MLSPFLFTVKLLELSVAFAFSWLTRGNFGILESGVFLVFPVLDWSLAIDRLNGSSLKHKSLTIFHMPKSLLSWLLISIFGFWILPPLWLNSHTLSLNTDFSLVYISLLAFLQVPFILSISTADVYVTTSKAVFLLMTSLLYF